MRAIPLALALAFGALLAAGMLWAWLSFENEVPARPDGGIVAVGASAEGPSETVLAEATRAPGVPPEPQEAQDDVPRGPEVSSRREEIEARWGLEVTDKEGRALAGAQVSWHGSWASAPTRGIRRGEWIGAMQLDGPLPEVYVSDASGWVQLPHPEAVPGAWLVTYPGAAPLWLALESAAPGSERKAILDTSAAIEASVFTVGGSPAPGAEVRALLVEADGAADAGPQGLRLQNLAPPPLRIAHADASGLTPLPFAATSALVQARQDERTSLPFHGRLDSGLKLELLATFQLAGQVHLGPSPRAALAPSIVVARAFLPGRSSSITLGSTQVQGDGSFGPMVLPLPEAYAWLDARLEFGDFAPREADLGDPREGDRVRVEFELVADVRQEVLVLNQDAQPIPGARVSLRWTEGEQTISAFDDTDAEGRASLRVGTTGMRHYSVHKQGHAEAVGLLPLVDEFGRSAEMTVYLSRAAQLQIEARRDGEPVSHFELFAWHEENHGPPRRETVQAADGRLLLADLEPGPWTLHLYDGTSPALPRTIELLAGEEATELFELQPPARLQGRILDRLSGVPIEGARALFGIGNRSSFILHFHVGSEPTEADGYFHLEHLPGGSLDISFRAPGYAGVRQLVNVAAGESADLGAIRLDPLGRASFQLDTGGAAVPAGLRVRCPKGRFEERTFDTSGRAEVEYEGSTLDYWLISHMGDSSYGSLRPQNLTRSEAGDFVAFVDAYVDREAWLLFDWPSDWSPPDRLAWELFYLDRRGLQA